ncbi:MAG: hypothetical protein RI885_2767 [Actinomycetota bacterium]
MMTGDTARPTVARVMVDSPLPQLDRLFDYAIPARFADEVAPGIRVRVPLRSIGRIADGFVVEVGDRAGFDGALSEIEAVVSTAPVLAPEVWTVARRVADRAAGSASDVIRLAVPKRQVRVEKAWQAREAVGEAAHDSDPRTARTPVEPHTLDGYGDARRLVSARLSVSAIPRVIALGSDAGGDTTRWVGGWAATMASAASLALADGGSAILCVPDYRDQDQLVAALHAILPADRIVQLDARQPAAARYLDHLRCLGAEPLVIVGNRSVVYAPAARLGLIALWDDGDPLHIEPLSPGVHSRDVALVRQELQGGGLWFVGHTRSTEVQRLVELGYLGELEPERAASPRVIPTAAQAPQDRFAAIARIPSAAWREARAAVEHGPVLVQVARPGYAPRLACTNCGQSARCLVCDGPLGTRTAGAVPACGWCGALAASWRCQHCSGEAFRLVGQGSARTADELGRAFPGVRVIAADGDHPVQFVDGSSAIVVATRGAEPIAAGGYRAVLLLDGERMLARESLRVAEDCLRWWANAAALAAPGAPVVLVGVGGALASAMSTWRLAAVAAAELVDRRELRFPPAVRVATVTGSAENVARALEPVRRVEGVDVLGPVEVTGGRGGLGDGVDVRAIVRFDYADGAAVASALRSEIVRVAQSRRKRAAGPRPAPPTLKVRCDDVEPFGSEAGR